MLKILNYLLVAAAVPLLVIYGIDLFTTPDMGRLYNDLAQQEDPYRNPIVVIPGLIGSRLVEQGTDTVAWGAFGQGQIDPDSAEGSRLIALPMSLGKELNELHDNVVPDGALDRVILNLMGFPVQLNAYYNILRTLGVGGYRDQGLGNVPNSLPLRWICPHRRYQPR